MDSADERSQLLPWDLPQEFLPPNNRLAGFLEVVKIDGYNEVGLSYQTLSKLTHKPAPSAGFVAVSKKLDDTAEQPLKTVSGIIVEQGFIKVHQILPE
jgi:hypothetical protein